MVLKGIEFDEAKIKDLSKEELIEFSTKLIYLLAYVDKKGKFSCGSCENSYKQQLSMTLKRGKLL